MTTVLGQPSKTVRICKILSAEVYLLNILAAWLVISSYYYLFVISGLVVIFLSTTMFMVTIRRPVQLVSQLERSSFRFVFTFPGRVIMDVVMSILLLGMGDLGFVCAMLTVNLVFIIRFVVLSRNEFDEVFRVFD